MLAKNTSLTFAFLLELVAFASFSCIGLLINTNRILNIIIFLVSLSVLITFWGLFMAPKAKYKFEPVTYYSFKVIIYVLSALVLWVKINPVTGIAFVVLGIIDEALLFKHNLS